MLYGFVQDQQRFFAPDIRPPKEPGPQFSMILYPVVSPLVCLFVWEIKHF
jgi:hypothetical protein